MAIQASRLNDDKYLHWLRTSLSLLYLKEGLCPFCDEKSKEFHADIKVKVQRKNNSAATSTCSTCISRNIKKKNQNGVFTWKLHCGRNICNEWLDEILLSHKDYPCPDIAWANSNPQLWPTDVWELAKLFQPYGCASHKSAADSDCQGLLRLMKTCTYFHTFLSNRIVLGQINDVRNACMHSSDLRVEETDMRRALNLMIFLLEQPHLINRPSCVEAKTKICQLRDNILDISLNKEFELQALNNRIEAVHGDVDSLEAELKTSLSDITARQDTTAEEYRKTYERVRELGQNITEMKTCQEQISQTVDTRLDNLEAQRQNKMADLTSRLQELETNSNTEIERLSKIETRLDNLEMQRIAQPTDHPVDIKGLQRKLVRMYKAQRKHIPVYMLRSDRKLQLDEIYVEQRLKVVDPDGRVKTDSTVSNSNIQAASGLVYLQSQDIFQSEQFVSSLRDVFFSDGNTCQYIYVSGNAGYGKSVFCSHIVRSWCTAHSENIKKLTPDEEFMTNFPLLFCIDLRDAKYVGNYQTPDEVCYLIQKQLQLCELGLTDNDLSKLLQDDGQVLVVMDALDECKEERLPKRGLYNHCTTLITSRPWKLEALRCDPEYKIDKELEIVGLKIGSPEDLSEKLVNLLNNKWKKSKSSKDFIENMEAVGLTEFLDVPILLTTMLCLWFDDVPFGQSQIEIYMNSIHHQILTSVKVKDLPQYSCPSEVPFPICQKKKCPCKQYGELLWKVSELAFKALLGNVRERSLVMDHDQTEYLGLTDTEVDVCMKLGILTQYKLLGNVTDYEPQKSVSFTHKTYQEWFAAIYLSSKVPVSNLDKLLTEGIVDLDSSLELDQLFLFVCGLNEEVAAKLSEFIMMMVSSDVRVQEYRKSNDVYTLNSHLVESVQNVIVAGAVESRKNGKGSNALQLHDVYIEGYRYSERFSHEQILTCDTSHARSVYIGYVEESKITPWPASSCLETLRLYNITNALDDTFCDNFSAAHLVSLRLQNITLSHNQLESFVCGLFSAGTLKKVNIEQLTCKTHQNNSHECCIELDLSQHVGMKSLRFDKLYQLLGKLPNVKITSWPPSISMDFSQYVNFEKLVQHIWARLPTVRITSWPSSIGMERIGLRNVDITPCDTFCDNFNVDNVSEIFLEEVRLTHDQMQILSERIACSVMLKTVSIDELIASAGRLTTVSIDKLNCKTHEDNRQECHIQLDFSQYVNFNKLWQAGWEWRPIIKITSCPASTCVETINLRHVNISPCDTFCDNFNVEHMSEMVLEDVTLTHEQLENLCGRMASSVKLKTVSIDELTCTTHEDNEHECHIHMDFSQYVNFEKLLQHVYDMWPTTVVKITSWPSSICMERVGLRYVDITPCDTFCDNFNVEHVSEMVLQDVTLTHEQLENLCGRMALSVKLKTVSIDKLTCTTHEDNEHECHIHMDFSQYVNFEKLVQSVWWLWPNVKITSWPSSICMESIGLRYMDITPCDTFCDNFNLDNVSEIVLDGVTLTHAQLEILCGRIASSVMLKTVSIYELTCKTHEDNNDKCHIHMDFSQYVNFEKLVQDEWGRWPPVRIANWPTSICMGRVGLRYVDITSCDTFCDNVNIDNVSEMVLEKVTMTHDQIMSLCGRLAAARSLTTVTIKKLACKTHVDNRQECSIILNLSPHQGLKHLELQELGVGEVRGVSLCQSMDKLELVELGGFCIAAAALRLTLEALPGHRVQVDLGGHYGVSPFRMRGADEARQLLEEIKQAAHTRVCYDSVKQIDDECVAESFMYYHQDR